MNCRSRTASARPACLRWKRPASASRSGVAASADFHAARVADDSANARTMRCRARMASTCVSGCRTHWRRRRRPPRVLACVLMRP